MKYFSTSPGKGLPLGNVTSQLFANIYMNELDQYIKCELKEMYYARYCDDFCIISDSRQHLEKCVEQINFFCNTKLSLNLHPYKISIRKINQGVDFLGYVLLPHYRVLRTHTKKRMLSKIEDLKSKMGKDDTGEFLQSSVQSYLGVLSHCKGEKIETKIERIFWD